MVRVGIVDDHPVTLWGLQGILDAIDGITVVRTCTSARHLDPYSLDIVLLDLYLANEVACIPLVASLSTKSHVVVMCSAGRPDDIADALDAGARGYVPKTSQPDRFAEVVLAVAAGETSTRPICDPRNAQLSTRERAVLAQIAWGLTHDQIASRLGISKHTVDTYVKRVRAKLHVGNKAELTRAAMRFR